MPDRDRLEWIFEAADEPTASAEAALAARYDEWADEYDDDNGGWGWLGPDLVAEAALRLAAPTPGCAIHDAGCGTGQAGIALRRAGWSGRVTGLDFSRGMLDKADRSDAYSNLIRCSLTDIPLADDVAAAVVSSGVFTHGHVGGESLAELARITKPGGSVTITQRVDVEAKLRPHAERLVEHNVWELVEQSEPRRLHPDRDEALQTIVSWRVR
jgi:SAM-dependent methyltransferase